MEAVIYDGVGGVKCRAKIGVACIEAVKDEIGPTAGSRTGDALGATYADACGDVDDIGVAVGERPLGAATWLADQVSSSVAGGGFKIDGEGGGEGRGEGARGEEGDEVGGFHGCLGESGVIEVRGAERGTVELSCTGELTSKPD